MEKSYNMDNGKQAMTHPNKNRQPPTTTSSRKRAWNINCDLETHEALDILGAWMLGLEHMPDELKNSLKIPKPTIVKILALEKLKHLGLLQHKKSEVATVK